MGPAAPGRLIFDIHPSAGPVVRKRGDPARLGREVAALTAAAGPGVVELVDHDGPRDAPTELVLATVTGETLGSSRLAAADVAPVMADVATTVARLHDAGVVHADLRDEHVIRGPHGPVLCGFGHAALRGWLDDPDDAWGAATAADVLALGELVHGAVAGLEGIDPVLRHALRRLVERATRPEPAERPPAHDLATSLRGLAHSAGPSARHDRSERLGARSHTLSRADGGPTTHRRWLITAAVAIGAVIAVAAVPALTRHRPGPPSALARSTTTAALARPAPAGPAPVLEGERVWPRDCGRPCASPVVHHQGVPYTAGDPGDLALVFDAGCDGRLDPVVVRPRTGAVFVFDAWPGPGRSVTAEPVARFPTAVTAVEAIDLDGDGCHELVGTSSAGPLPMQLAGTAP